MPVEFRQFLKKGGRSDQAADRVMDHVKSFENFLLDQCGKGLMEATPEDLEKFVTLIEQDPKTSAKNLLWGVIYYYKFRSNDEMRRFAGMLRENRMDRKSFPLKDFQDINPEDLEKLAKCGIRNVKQMLEKGNSKEKRTELARKTGVSEAAILELVKLSDLARLPGVKGIRARLYYDAGVDSIEKLAGWEPEALRKMMAGFVSRTGFKGTAPLPAEVRNTVAHAQKLPKIVEN